MNESQIVQPLNIEKSEPGSYVLVPINTWHTAKVRAPSRMFFITPGEGTENRRV